MAGQTGGSEWRIYGGHRLWHAPEVPSRTYYPDNGPVEIAEHDGWVRLTQPAEPTTGIQKEIDLRLAPEEAQLTVSHRLRNNGLWEVELGPWALSVMAQEGQAIIPLPPRGDHAENLLPTSSLTLWAYTDLSDPRWSWGREYIMLRQDPKIASPQKIGVRATDGWIACARHDHVFVKTFTVQPGATYPDFGCTVESYTDANMLELETLGPLVRLQPGATVEHLERWFLFRGAPAPRDEVEVDLYILPKIQAALKSAT
jgi:hypothetical protein